MSWRDILAVAFGRVARRVLTAALLAALTAAGLLPAEPGEAPLERVAVVAADKLSGS